MFDELLKCSNIEAVKESTRDISNVTRIKNRFGERLKIMTGVDTVALESMIMGADHLRASKSWPYTRGNRHISLVFAIVRARYKS